MLRALIFDVDGTLAETEELHRVSFNQAFAEHGLPWVWDAALYRQLLATTGGRERILVHARATGMDVDAAALHARKTAIYNDGVASGAIALRPGVEELIRRGSRDGLLLAIGTTTSRPNVVSLLRSTLGEDAPRLFASIRSGEDVARKKPDPEVYRLVLDDLALAADECVCFEDSRNGLLAAKGVGLRTIVTPGIYTATDDFTGADLILTDLSQPWSCRRHVPPTSLVELPSDVIRLLLTLS